MEKQKKFTLVRKITILLYAILMPLFMVIFGILSYATNELSLSQLENRKNSVDDNLIKFQKIYNTYQDMERYITSNNIFKDMLANGVNKEYFDDFDDSINYLSLINTNIKEIDIVFIDPLVMFSNISGWTIGSDGEYYTKKINDEIEKLNSNIEESKNNFFMKTTNGFLSRTKNNIQQISCDDFKNTKYFIFIESWSDEFASALNESNAYNNEKNYIYDRHGKSLESDSIDADVIDMYSKPTTINVVNKKDCFEIYGAKSNLFAIKKVISKSDINYLQNVYEIVTFIFIIVVVALCLVYALVMNKFLSKPLNKLQQAFNQVQNDRNVRIVITDKSEFNYIYKNFNKMVSKLIAFSDDNTTLKLLNQQSELKYLQSQIDPHFLYNAYFFLYSLAEAEGSECVAAYTKKLGQYFQYMGKSSADSVTLAQEIQHSLNYIDLQKERLGNKIDFCYEADLQTVNLLVPKFIIQPLLENSFKYARQADKVLKLRLTIKEDFDKIVISVGDNGDKFSDDKIVLLNDVFTEVSNQMMGATYNVVRRLKLFLSNKNSVVVSRSSLGGMEISINIYKDNNS